MVGDGSLLLGAAVGNPESLKLALGVSFKSCVACSGASRATPGRPDQRPSPSVTFANRRRCEFCSAASLCTPRGMRGNQPAARQKATLKQWSKRRQRCGVCYSVGQTDSRVSPIESTPISFMHAISYLASRSMNILSASCDASKATVDADKGQFSVATLKATLKHGPYMRIYSIGTP